MNEELEDRTLMLRAWDGSGKYQDVPVQLKTDVQTIDLSQEWETEIMEEK